MKREEVELLYEESRDQDHYEALISHMTSGPSLILCLAKDNAIEQWRNKIGPNSNAKENAPDTIRV